MTVGLYDNVWLPFEQVDQGKAQGLTFDVLTEATNLLGVKLKERRYANWGEVLRAACAGEVDIVMDIALTAERTRCMVFTRQYADAPVALVSRMQDVRAAHDAELTGLRLVTERDFVFSSIAQERYPAAVHIQAQTTREALQMVSDGKADVYLGNAHVANALITGAGIPRIGLQRQADLPADSLHFGVPNAQQPLAEALDIALAAIPEARSQAIRAQWIQPLQWLGSGTLALTAKEIEAVAQPLKIGFAPTWAPITFVDDEGQPSGIAGEYLDRFRMAGADKLRTVKLDSWQAIRDAMRTEQLDAVMGVPNDASAFGDDWVFSQPFLTVSNVIVVGNSGDRVLDMRDLDGRRVALSDPDRIGTLLRAQAPGVVVQNVATASEGLEQVRAGKADAYIGNLAVVDRFLR
ncbi:MAG: transporter substrate-binding domain-containing protein, partial [Stenotrophomonas sp.]